MLSKEKAQELSIMATLGSLGSLAGRPGLLRFTGIPSGPKNQCVECRAEVPPGKAGRKCKECRKKQSDDTAV